MCCSTTSGGSATESGQKSGLTASIYLLSAVRVVLCMMPQNQWLSAASPLSWGIYRNIPFALLGLLDYRAVLPQREGA